MELVGKVKELLIEIAKALKGSATLLVSSTDNTRLGSRRSESGF